MDEIAEKLENDKWSAINYSNAPSEYYKEWWRIHEYCVKYGGFDGDADRMRFLESKFGIDDWKALEKSIVEKIRGGHNAGMK